MTRKANKLIKNYKLTTGLIAAFILVSLFALLISGVSQAILSYKVEKQLVSKRQELIAQKAAHNVSEFIADKFMSLENAITYGDLMNMGVAMQQGKLESLLFLDPSFRTIVLEDKDGSELMRVSRLSRKASKELNLVEYSPLRGILSSDYKFMSRVYIDHESSEPMILIAVPIINLLQEFEGAILAEVKLKYMWDITDALSFGETGVAYVVNQEGNLLAFEDISRVLNGENLRHLQAVQDFTAKQDYSKQTETAISRGINGTKVISTYVPLNNPNWAVVTEQSVKEALAPVYQKFAISIGFFILSLLVSVAFSFYLARIISKPIQDINKTAIQISRGDLELQVPVKGPIELAALANSFNRMTSKLRFMLEEEAHRSLLLKKEIQNRKNIEIALRENEEKYRTLFQTSQYAILVLDPQKGYVDCNPAALKLFKIPSKKDLLKMSPAALSPRKQPDGTFSDVKAKEEIGKALQEGTHIFEWTHSKITGEEFYAVVEATRMTIGKQVLLQGTIRDVTQQKKAEQNLKLRNKEYEALNQELSESLDRMQALNLELEKAKIKAEESDRLKSAFLANMSHEIRTPMNGILGFANLLQEEQLTLETQHEYIQIIQDSGNRMLSIINDLIDISKIEAGEMMVNYGKVSLPDIMNQLFSFFKPLTDPKGNKLILSLPAAESSNLIISDELKISQVLTNLITNANKYTQMGTIEFGYVANQESLTFFVHDTGTGIPKAYHPIVFERFHQAETELTRVVEGTGLGLSISKAFVEMLGGKIWFDSIEGKGSSFYFSLPNQQSHEALAQGSGSRQAESIDYSGKTVLVAEDDDINFAYMEAELQHKSLVVLRAQNGQEALELCRQHPEIELVIMDIRMPVMDGLTATQAIKKEKPELPILAQTAYVSAEYQQHAQEAGCDGFIEKPVKRDVLNHKLEMFLKG